MDYVSCGAHQLYQSGGFYDGPMLAEQLTAEPPQEIRIMSRIFPAYSYVRKLPRCIEASDEFRSKLLAYYAQINLESRTGASSTLVELSNVALARNVLYVQGQGHRRIVYETCRPPDRPWSPLLPADAAVTAYPVERDTLYFLLASVGSFNYGHWLLDDVARLRAIKALRAAYPRQTIVILLPTYAEGMEPTLSRQWDEVRAAAVTALLGDTRRYRIAFVEISRAYSFTRLYYATPISFHPVLKSPEALTWLTRRMVGWNWRLPLRRGPSRLLVLRRATRGRSVENMESVRTLLESRGFTSVDPEDLSVAEQAAAFARARTVVGVMGASMSNTVFCRPGTRVIHLAPEGWMEPFYWDLAAVRKHVYAACYGPAHANDGNYMGSFQIPEESLLRVLQALDQA